jgi:hypothetical protein
MKCRVCRTRDKDKPMCFRMTDACCERHRKLIAEEPGMEPTFQEWVTMDYELFDALAGTKGGTYKTRYLQNEPRTSGRGSNETS